MASCSVGPNPRGPYPCSPSQQAIQSNWRIGIGGQTLVVKIARAMSGGLPLGVVHVPDAQVLVEEADAPFRRAAVLGEDDVKDVLGNLL